MNTQSTAGVIQARRMAVWVLVAGCLMLPATVAFGAEPDAAMQAYELRMAGKADEGKALLEQAISENPEDAAAHYELARTLYHMALGNPPELEDLMDRAQQSIEKATQWGPKNGMHHTLAGHIAYIRGYSHMMHGTGNEAAARAQFDKARGAYESALKVDPDRREVALYVVELHASLPENMGGERSIAERYAEELEGIDPLLGAKANSILTERDAAFWEGVQEELPGPNAHVLEELGKAYLRQDRVDDAIACFEKAVDIDPKMAYLFLDLSIYHTFRALRAGNGSELFQTSVKAGDATVTRYIESEPIAPMLAHALGVQSKYKRLGLGDTELGQRLLERAESLDPYFSKAMVALPPVLFVAPGMISHNHRYLLRPF